MKLPTLSLPKYRLQVPSSKQDISFRPFLVKEQKALLMSLESENLADILDAIRDTIKSCTYDTVDVDDLPLFDLCYIFINIRAKSVGEIAEPKISCSACKHSNSVQINLTEIKVHFPPNFTTKIEFNSESGVIMKCPTISTAPILKEMMNSMKMDNLPLIAACIDKIYVGDSVYTTNDYTDTDRREFVENLTAEQFEKLLAFFETMPSLTHKVEFDCEKCGHKNSMTLEGLRDFFL